MHGGLGLDAGEYTRHQLHLALQGEPREPHLDVDDGEVDHKGGGGRVLVLQQQRLYRQLDPRVVLDPFVDVD